MKRQTILSPLVILTTLLLAGADADPAAVNPTGDSSAEVLAVSGTGKADGGFLAISGTGNAESGFVAVSGTGDASILSGTWCLSAIGRHHCSSGGIWASGQGSLGVTNINTCGGSEADTCDSDTSANVIAFYVLGEESVVTVNSSSRDRLVVAMGDASADWIAISVGGDAAGGWGAASATGRSHVEPGPYCFAVLGRYSCNSGGILISGQDQRLTITDLRSCMGTGEPPGCPTPYERNVADVGAGASTGEVAVAFFGDAHGRLVAISLFGEGYGALVNFGGCGHFTTLGNPELCA